jgi:hypothetical protein
VTVDEGNEERTDDPLEHPMTPMATATRAR